MGLSGRKFDIGIRSKYQFGAAVQGSRNENDGRAAEMVTMMFQRICSRNEVGY